jgi:hypothetical protein
LPPQVSLLVLVLVAHLVFTRVVLVLWGSHHTFLGGEISAAEAGRQRQEPGLEGVRPAHRSQRRLKG